MGNCDTRGSNEARRLTMQYQVFVQNPSEQRFVASVVGLPSVMVEVDTPHR
jgi:hypothetical protein